MSSLTSLYGSGGIPINGLAQFANAPVLYTDLDSKIWLKAGNVSDDSETYPDAISVAWNVSTATYLQAFSVAGQEIYPSGVFFKPDGTKMYVLGGVGVDVNEYDLSSLIGLADATGLDPHTYVRIK